MKKAQKKLEDDQTELKNIRSSKFVKKKVSDIVCLKPYRVVAWHYRNYAQYSF